MPEVVRQFDEMIGVGPFQLENILSSPSLSPSPLPLLFPSSPHSVVICSIEVLFY